MTTATMVRTQAQGLRDTARWADDRVVRYGTTARTLRADARVLAGAWTSPLATRLVEDVDRRTVRLERSAGTFQDVATVLSRAATQAEEISSRLASLETREQELSIALGRIDHTALDAGHESETLRRALSTTRHDLEAVRDSWEDESRRTADHLNSATQAVNGAAAEEESDAPSVLDRVAGDLSSAFQSTLFRGGVHAWNSYSAIGNTHNALRWFSMWFE